MPSAPPAAAESAAMPGASVLGRHMPVGQHCIADPSLRNSCNCSHIAPYSVMYHKGLGHVRAAAALTTAVAILTLYSEYGHTGM